MSDTSSDTNLEDTSSSSEEASPSQPQPTPLLYFSHLSLSQALVGAGGLFVLLLVFRFQAFLSLSEAYIGGAHADAGLYIWLTQSNIRDLFELPWFTTSAFYPYTRTLAWSDNFILPSFVVWFFQACGASHVVAYNLTLLLAQFLSGFFTFYLAYRLSDLILPSLVAGASFMLAGYFTAQLGHPQLQFTLFFPLGLMFLFRFLAKKDLLSGFAFGITVLCAFLTTVYYSLFLCLIGLLFFIAFWLLRPAKLSVGEFLRFGLTAALGLSPLLFFLFPYLDVKDVFGSRGLYEPYAFAASALSYVSAGPLHLLYSFTSSWTHAEAYFFPGLLLLFLFGVSYLRATEAKQLKKRSRFFLISFIVALVCSERDLIQLIVTNSRADVQVAHVLATLALWSALFFLAKILRQMGELEKRLGFEVVTNRALIGIFFFIAISFIAVSLGPLGNTAKGDISFSPFSLLFYVVPGFDSLRAVSRASLVALFCFSLLIPFTLPLLRYYKKSATGVCFVALLIVLLENAYTTYPLEPLDTPSAVVQHLAQTDLSRDDVILFLPWTDELTPHETVKSWGEFAYRNTDYMNAAFTIGASTLNGYSGQRSSIMKKYPRKMSGFPDRRSMDTLQFIPGLKYIVYDLRAFPGMTLESLLEKAKGYPDELSFITSDEANKVLFRYTPRSVLRDSFYLRTPSYPAGLLDLELEGQYETDSPTITINLIEHDHFGGKPITTFELPASGEKETISLVLPESSRRAHPYRLSFRYDNSHKVTLYARKHSYLLNAEQR